MTALTWVCLLAGIGGYIAQTVFYSRLKRVFPPASFRLILVSTGLAFAVMLIVAFIAGHLLAN